MESLMDSLGRNLARSRPTLTSPPYNLDHKGLSSLTHLAAKKERV